MSLNYYIEDKIQLFEWPAFSPYLNHIENIWINIKYKLEVNAYKKIKCLKANILQYWINCVTHLSGIIGDSMKKINA